MAKSARKFSKLEERARRLAEKSKSRKRLALDITEAEYSRLLDLVESWGENLATVMRACFRYGLEHAESFVPHAQKERFAAKGDWSPRPQSRIDPTGRYLPSQVEGMTPPRDVQFPPQYQPRRPFTTEYTEQIFSQTQMPSWAKPSGAQELPNSTSPVDTQGYSHSQEEDEDRPDDLGFEDA